MKRSTLGGTSPAYKFTLSRKQSRDTSVASSQDSDSDNGICDKLLRFSTNQPMKNATSSLVQLDNSTESTEASMEFNFQGLKEYMEISSQQTLSSQLLTSNTDVSSLNSLLEKAITTEGVSETATILLQNNELKKELMNQLCNEAHNQFKSSLSSSVLTTPRRDRTYLLSLTPRILCEELQRNSPLCFNLLVQGFFGTSADKVNFSAVLISFFIKKGKEYN